MTCSQVYRTLALKVLNLNGNHLAGNLTSSLGQLQSLEELDLRNNAFTGSIPSSFQNLRKLRLLRLDGNKLSGALPEWMPQLSSLQTFTLGNNSFCGPLPEKMPSSVCDSWDAGMCLLPGQQRESACPMVPPCTNNTAAECPGANVLMAKNPSTGGVGTTSFMGGDAASREAMISGIVVGCVFAVVAVGFLVKFWTRKNTRKSVAFMPVPGGEAKGRGADGSRVNGADVAALLATGESPFIQSTTTLSNDTMASNHARHAAPRRDSSLVSGQLGLASTTLQDHNQTRANAAGGLAVPPEAEGTCYDPMRRRYITIRPHTPSRSDELPLEGGDTVTVERVYPDQWCIGWMHRNGHRGMFPLTCVVVIDANDIEDLDQEHVNPPVPGTTGPKNCLHTKTPSETYVVVVAHDPDFIDEIKLEVGQHITIEHFYRDAWCLGYNHATQTRGLFPLRCLDKAKGDSPKPMPSPLKIQRPGSVKSIRSITDTVLTLSPTDQSPEPVEARSELP
ncbi:hypothetical protein HK104_010481 [Borealophlyctis nickersoniae]|nr:hypothetical protein HK104_010481 [Borealophlyctis nickersoniae]